METLFQCCVKAKQKLAEDVMQFWGLDLDRFLEASSEEGSKEKKFPKDEKMTEESFKKGMHFRRARE